MKVVVKNRFGQVQAETVDVERAWLKALTSDKRPKVIAHRGYWRYAGAVQNSLSSLRASAKAGVYGSEFDVQITADGAVLYRVGRRIRYLHSVFHLFIILGCVLQFFKRRKKYKLPCWCQEL